MSNITKKQATLAVIAVVFATAMIVSVIASSDSVFAKDGKKVSVKNQQNQNSKCKTAGGNSGISGTGQLVGTCGNGSISETSNTGGTA